MLGFGFPDGLGPGLSVFRMGLVSSAYGSAPSKLPLTLQGLEMSLSFPKPPEARQLSITPRIRKSKRGSDPSFFARVTFHCRGLLEPAPVLKPTVLCRPLPRRCILTVNPAPPQLETLPVKSPSTTR